MTAIARRGLLNGLLVAGLTASVIRSVSATTSAGKLKCRAWMDDKNLNLTGRYRLTAGLESVGNNCRVYVPMGFGSLGFLFETLDSSNQTIDTPFGHAAHPFVPKLPVGPENLAELYPGMSIAASLEGDVRELFPKPGSYSIGVVYKSPIFRDAISPSDPSLVRETVTREDGEIYASPISVVVN